MIERTLPEETIFAQARGLESDTEREAYLDRACGDDPGLRAEVEALLRADARTGDLLDVPERAGPPLPLPGAERPGDAIGPYSLVRVIGEGGMGVVWLAEQARPVRRRVALKIIKPGTDSRRVIARFEAERQALAMMDHPHIARVLDAGATRLGRPFFIMELVEGAPITAYCDAHRLPPRHRLELFLSVCAAVQHAHQKGIIHRDIKPSNVLVADVDDRPVPKVIDFGVAKAIAEKLTERTLSTQCGQVVGTLEYMSPEQATLQAGDVDTRSDVHALGVLLYELLTGTTPIEKSRLRRAAFDEALRIIREEEPPRPSARLSQLGRSRPPDRPEEPAADPAAIASDRRTDPARLRRMIRGELDWIAMKALEKDPGRRYETVSGLMADLRRYLADEPVSAGPPSVLYRLRKASRRNRRAATAAAAVVLALVAGIVGTPGGLPPATDPPAAAVGAAAQKQAALAEARGQLFEALLHRARSGRYGRRMGQRLDTLGAVARAARIRRDDRLRDEAIAAMALPDLRPVPGWPPGPSAAGDLAYGRDFRLSARAVAPGVVAIRDLDDDRELRRIDAGPLPESFAFSPGDRFLIGLGRDSALGVWRVDDGRPALRDRPRGCMGHAFSPDGGRLWVGHQGWILAFDLATGREVERWRLPARASELAIHPDGTRLAVGYDAARDASVYDIRGGAHLADLPVGPLARQHVAWHPDGERLAVVGTDPRIQVWDVAARRRVATLEGHSSLVSALSFHPGGDLLATHGWDGVVILWHPDGGRPVMRWASLSSPRFSDDGRWLGVTMPGERTDRFEVVASREYRTMVDSRADDADRYRYGCISPDGRLLAVSRDGGARLWDLHAGRKLAAMPAGARFIFFEGRGRADGRPDPSTGPPPAVLTSGTDGLRRWPLTSDDPEGRRLRLGAPRRLSPLPLAWFAPTPDGRTLAAASTEGGLSRILDLETGAVRRELDGHPRGQVQAISGDGRWAASCGWVSDRVRLWEVDTGRMAREWVVGRRTRVFFTPDSRALVISRGDEVGLWDVRAAEPILRLRRDVDQLASWVAFSPDGRMMALEMAPAVIDLKEVATGRTVARLEDPHGDRATWLGFTPDGTRLVAVSRFAGTIHVWDLRAIRERLKALDLDWDWPESPPASGPDSAGRAVIAVRFDDEAGRASDDAMRAKEIDRLRRELAAHPDSAGACNGLAWEYLMAPGPLRDVDAAVPLAEKAMRLDPANPSVRNTLGLAYHRAGRDREAVDLLRINLEQQDHLAMAYDLYILAMSCHRLGEAERARDYYTLATRWEGGAGLPAGGQWAALAVVPEEVAALRAEAEAMLGTPASASPLRNRR